MYTTLGYLYDQIHYVIIGTGPIDRWNRMAYAKNVKVYKGIDNIVKFKIRNNNQKDVNVAQSTFKLSVVDTVTGNEKFYTILDIENAQKGLLTTTISELDLLKLENNLYHYSIKMTDGEGVDHPIYVDDNYGAAGVLEVHGKTFPGLSASVSATIGSSNLGVAYTSSIVNDYNSGLGTAAYYMTNFTGSIEIQAHMETASTVEEDDYFTVGTTVYNNENGVVYANFTGAFRAVRFKITTASGSVDQILVKI